MTHFRSTSFFIAGIAMLSVPEIFGGDVKISEFSASSSERLLQWSDDEMPRLGSGTPWWEENFNDEKWPSGFAPIGFNYDQVVTDVGTEMFGITPSLYLRKTFQVTAGQAASTADLLLDIDFDDGFIVFLNGKEVARANMGAAGGFVFADQPSYNGHGWSGNETFNLGAVEDLLQAGENIIAIQIHNVSATSGALFFDAGLKQTTGGTVNFVSKGSGWNYFVGRVEPSGGVFDPAFLPDAGAFEPEWAEITFDDSEWSDGAGPLGYDANSDYPLGTDLDGMRYNQSVLYTRRKFTLDATQLASISSVNLSVDYDDGFIAFLNGVEIARSTNMGAAGLFVPYDATAFSGHNASMDSGNQGAIENIVIDQSLLTVGENVLAIQMCNSSLGSSDLMVIPDLTTNGGTGPQLVSHSDIHRYFIGTEEPAPIQNHSEDAIEPSFVDWIEIHNAGTAAADLTGWSLSDSKNNPQKWTFPAGTEIAPGGYLLVLADGMVPGSEETDLLHASFKLSADGDFLGLYDDAGIAQTEFDPEYPKQYDFHSYGLDPAGGAIYGYLSEPSPGAANGGPFLSGRTKSPDFDVKGGFHDNTVNLSLFSDTPGATIRYTTDGTDPTLTNGIEYTSSLSLPQINDKTGHVIRARSFATGMIPSKVKTHTFLIGLHPDLQTAPALIFSGDEARNFFKPHGIMAIEGGTYVNGRWQSNGINSYNIPINRGRPYERPIHLEMYYGDGRDGIRETVGLRLSSSNYSRPRLRLTSTASSPWPSNATQKPSFNIFCRNDYGAEQIEHQWIEDDYTVERFQQFRVRAGKNDIRNPFIVDQVIRNLYHDMGNVSSRGINNTVFINGELKGFFNLSERLREPFFQEHHDSDEEWDVRQVGDFANGDNIKWNEMMALLQEDLTVLANYEAVQEILDIDNFIDYLLVNIYGATWDWPQNNWVAARERSETGLWRFYVWDAEGAIGRNRGPDYDTIQTDLINKNREIPNIFKFLRNSPEFRLRWADRVQKHFFHDGALDDRNGSNSAVRTHWDHLAAAHEPLLRYIHNENVNSTRVINWTDPSSGKRSFLFGPGDTQFANHGLWPDLKAPTFSQHGGNVSYGRLMSISHDGTPGAAIYTTVDGSDPRLPGGGISPSATRYQFFFVLKQAHTHLKARVYIHSTGEWSPLNEAIFNIQFSPVLVNEVLTHTDLPEVDSIELYNPNSNPVDISGWFISDNTDIPKKFKIPENTEIPAGGYLVFDEADFNVGPNAFRLSEYGEQAYLFSADENGDLTGYSHGWDFRAAPNGVTTGTHVDSLGVEHFVLQETNTLGASNSLPLTGPVVISEINYHPPDLEGGVDNDSDEFIELTNTSTIPVPLFSTFTNVPGYGDSALNDTWQLRNAVDYDFPPGVELQPGEKILVVGFDPATEPAQLISLRSKYNIPTGIRIFGPWSGKLDNSGEEIELKYPGAADAEASFFVPYYMAEEIDYRDSAPWSPEADGLGFSLQRIDLLAFANEPQNWRADTPQILSRQDTDNDNIEDWWEILHGLNIGINDSALDLDFDGFTNVEEFKARTSPKDSESRLHLKVRSTETGVRLDFTAAPEVAYTIQQSDALVTPTVWTNLQEIAAEPTAREIEIEVETPDLRQFFKLIISPEN